MSAVTLVWSVVMRYLIVTVVVPSLGHSPPEAEAGTGSQISWELS